MKLDVFEFIDDVINEVDSRKEEIEAASKDLVSYFNHVLKNQLSLYDISERIKTETSIREKILRQNYFLRYKTVDNVLFNMSDIIGLRVQCRFTRDEEKIFKSIKEYFALEARDFEGYYYNPRNDKVLLKLDDDQPQTQVNGFSIYRIDGKYLTEDGFYNFELQIKSFVNVFWGDIEHEILYKNFSYMITEGFVRDMLYSIKRSLEQVDSQLLSVHEYLNGLEQDPEIAKINQLKRLVSKLIHDLFAIGFKESTGVLLDFRNSADLITDYLFSKAYFYEKDVAMFFMNLVDSITKFDDKDFDYGAYISLEDSTDLVYRPSQRIGSGVGSIINDDLKWNLIFSIIMVFSDLDKDQEFALFMDYLVYQISGAIERAMDNFRIDEDLKESMKSKFLENCVDVICDYYDSDIFSKSNMNLVSQKTQEAIDRSNGDSVNVKTDQVDYDWFREEVRKEAEF